MADETKIDTLADAVDALIGIQPRKTAVTDPELTSLLHIAHLRRHLARSYAASAARDASHVWRRLSPAFTLED